MSELKPCPFCGCNARVMRRPKHDSNCCWAVDCLECGAENRSFATEAAAIAAWNRRATSPADPAALRSAVLTEREECAKLAKGYPYRDSAIVQTPVTVSEDIAAAIRSRTP